MIEAIELTSTRRSRGARGGPVEKVSFDVYPGQVTALLGAPGAGKSTVLRLMVELEPGGGRTLFGGRPFRALRPAIREVGLALNPDAVHPGRTVQAHLQLYSAAGGVPKGRVAEVLEVAGLSTQATVRCGRLDPGQRQRLAIAAALLGDPAALILDEPHALDSHGMSWFHALIRAYAAQGRTVLVAATDPDSLSGTADHVVILRRDEHDGVSRVIASRSAAEVFDERRVTVVQVRSPQAARLAAALESEGARLAPAGPGALQVRGLDRARIGEVAHVAGICLHELSEIGHDDDVFGLRPVPRQKELLPGLNRTDATWRAGVRVVAEEIEEAEVVEPAEQSVTAAVGPQAEAGGAVSVGTGGDAAEVATMATPTQQPSQGTIAGPRESATPEATLGQSAAQAGAKARWHSQGSQWWAVKSVAEQPPKTPATEVESRLAPAAPTRVPAATASIEASDSQSSVQAAAVSTSPQPGADVQQADGQHVDGQQVVGQQADGQHVDGQQFVGQQVVAQESVVSPVSAAAEQASNSASPASPNAESSTPAAEAPVVVRSVEAPALRRSSSFSLRWGRDKASAAKPPAETVPASVQPAVPFTIAAPASGQDAAADGMTPWRAVAVRAPHNQQQASVAEAAPAEQETSA